ncbi:DUF488 domain-containing protein [Halomonas shantousis]
MPYDIVLKRIYSEADPHDGSRVLVDRLWPRGKRRDNLMLTDWYRDASPSNVLRRQWHQSEIGDGVFARRYRWEIEEAADCLLPLMRWARQGRLTLLSAARDLENSHLPILRQAILDALAKEDLDATGHEVSSPPCYASTFSERTSS